MLLMYNSTVRNYELGISMISDSLASICLKDQQLFEFKVQDSLWLPLALPLDVVF